MTTPDAQTQELGLDVLVIDDERNIRSTIALCVEKLGCRAVGVASGEAALAALAERPCDLAFLDMRLGQESGLDLLPQLLTASPGIAVVMITAYATIDSAVDAIRRGAAEYLPKPFTPAQIRLCVEQVAERTRLRRRVHELEQRIADLTPEADLDSSSPRMRAVLEMIDRAARSEAAVLLTGESGTGKSLLAQVLHARSARAAHPLVVVNCPTLSEELLASELFGHVRGAFTGAVRDQAGRVEAAQGGTLFLDEIGEISPALQVKLLRFLQEKAFERIGETRTRHADVRVVAATNRDLEKDVAAGRFREDLLYRLNVVEVEVPSLRERPEDLLRLARRFLEFAARAAGRPTPTLSRAAETVLLAYSWPGNVRELRNAMERAVILWPAQEIEPEAFAARITAAGGAGGAATASRGELRLGGRCTLEAIEQEHIRRIVESTPTFEEAARVLGIESSTLWRKRKKLDG